jgi:hypothetical protein
MNPLKPTHGCREGGYLLPILDFSRERCREQRLQAIEKKDSSSTNVHSLQALERQEQAELKQLLSLKARTEYRDRNSHSSVLNEAAVLKTGTEGICRERERERV